MCLPTKRRFSAFTFARDFVKQQPNALSGNKLEVNLTLFGLIVMFFAGTILAPAQTFQPGPRAEATESMPAEPAASATAEPYHPITGSERMSWFVNSTVGPQTLTVGLLSAGIGTARNAPQEYGGSWEGFGKRYGMRLTGVATGNAMEAGFGALWGEDPRYFRANQQPFGGRIKNVVAMTFLAHDRTGRIMPAYARYIATPGNNFLSNTWRADSEATSQAALVRTMWGFVGLMGKNAFIEFWPDVQRKVFHKKH